MLPDSFLMLISVPKQGKEINTNTIKLRDDKTGYFKLETGLQNAFIRFWWLASFPLFRTASELTIISFAGSPVMMLTLIFQSNPSQLGARSKGRYPSQLRGP